MTYACHLSAMRLSYSNRILSPFLSLKTISETVYFLLNDIRQSVRDAQKGSVAGLQLQEFPVNTTLAHERVLRERGKRLVLGCVQVNAASVIGSVLVVNRSGRRGIE